MPCPHNEITIVQRSQRQSAVAAAAYQSGEKLFCEYDQQVKHYPEKRGIVHNEILLPANAPPEYADRNTLWNAAEAVEKQWNSQLARRWVLTIPREIPPDQYAVLVREFCQQQFVSKGMIADFAIHDPHPPGHNPHAHVLLTRLLRCICGESRFGGLHNNRGIFVRNGCRLVTGCWCVVFHLNNRLRLDRFHYGFSGFIGNSIQNIIKIRFSNGHLSVRTTHFINFIRDVIIPDGVRLLFYNRIGIVAILDHGIQ